MTKKDYELIAEVLREYIWYGNTFPSNMRTADIVKMVANDLSDVFASEIPRFNYSKFMEACTP